MAFLLEKVEMSSSEEKDSWAYFPLSPSFSNVVRVIGLLTIEGETCSLKHSVWV